MAERRSVAAYVLGSNPSSRTIFLSIEPARRRTSSHSESALIHFSPVHFTSFNSSKVSRPLAVVPVIALCAACDGEPTVVGAYAAKAGKP